MRLRQAAAWQALSDDARLKVEFVLTLTELSGRQVHFSDRAELVQDRTTTRGQAVTCRPGLLGSLAGCSISLDPRFQGNPLPSIPQISLAKAAIEDAFGGVPRAWGELEAEIAILCPGISSWDDRLIVIGGARVDPGSVQYTQEGEVSVGLLDPMMSGGQGLVPEDRVDPDLLPSGWLANLVQRSAGIPFPICYGEIWRAPAIKVYDDEGTPPTRRYIVARGHVEDTTITAHLDDDSTLSKTPALIQTQDDDNGEAIVFTYIETSGTDEETANVEALSFTATSGEAASPGRVIRDILQAWTKLDLDAVSEQSLAELSEDLSTLRVAALIDGEGADAAYVSEIVANRFANQFPLRVGRFGGRLFLSSVLGILQPEGPSYQVPTEEIRIGTDAYLLGNVRETGDVFNSIEVYYQRRNDDGLWEAAPLRVTPENDAECQRSSVSYGLRQMAPVLLDDVYDAATAGALLEHLKSLYLDPWYFVTVAVPLRLAWLLPLTKIKIDYSQDSFLQDVLIRKRWNLARSTSASTRDGIVTDVAYHRTHCEIGVLC